MLKRKLFNKTENTLNNADFTKRKFVNEAKKVGANNPLNNPYFQPSKESLELYNRIMDRSISNEDFTPYKLGILSTEFGNGEIDNVAMFLYLRELRKRGMVRDDK